MTDNWRLRKGAEQATISLNNKVYEELPFDEAYPFPDAKKNLLKMISKKPVYRTDPETGDQVIVWDPNYYDFVHDRAPDTVNPSLWRQSELTNIGGLFEVVSIPGTDTMPELGIYQVRNYDLANLTIIESTNGLILVDVLTCAETAKASLDLYYEWIDEHPNRKPEGRKPVIAVIFTHSHVDHYAGIINGVTTEEDIKSGKVCVYAPEGFLEHACSENFYMGNIMGRRALYMYGNLLPGDSKGDVGCGLGSGRAVGTITLTPLIRPITDEIAKTGFSIDTLEFEFMLTPNTEAPAEMHLYLPYFKALCTAENAVSTMHNVYSLRGAQIRDALSWSKDLNKTLNRWGNIVNVLFGVHHWPVWDNRNIVNYLKKQRDLYRYMNDQTVRLANLGYKPVEIAEMLNTLPEVLESDWNLRGYYGSLNHNIKSIYVKYLGWFDGNPATLHTLPTVAAGMKYVEYMGGATKLLERAKLDFDNGEYRWVAEVLNHLVSAEPQNVPARARLADTLEQLGYQAESGPWRNFYLSGAQELRYFANKQSSGYPSMDAILSLSPDAFLDYMAMLLIGPDIGENDEASFMIEFTDIHEAYFLGLENAVLNHSNMKSNPNPSTPELLITTTRKVFYGLVFGIAGGEITDIQSAVTNLINTGELVLKPKNISHKFINLLDHLQVLPASINIVEPVGRDSAV